MSEEEVRKAILGGRIEFSDRALIAIQNMDLKNPDKTLTTVSVSFWGPWGEDGEGNKGGMGIDWMTVSAGCGRCDFRVDNDGKMRCYNQDMSKEFIMTLLQFILAHTELDSDDPSN